MGASAKPRLGGIMMSLKAKIWDYLTLLSAILTIVAAGLNIIEKTSSWFPVVLLLLTLILRTISTKINEKELKLKKEEKEILDAVFKKKEKGKNTDIK